MSVSQHDVFQRQLRRLQFVLGPRAAAAPPGWVVEEVAGGLSLTRHPDLNVVGSRASGAAITLIGYLLDPDSQQASDADILVRLSAVAAADGDLFEALAALGGRYLLIVEKDGLKLVGDANGSLQVFHASTKGETWCAAQADLLAAELGFDPDPEAAAYIERAVRELGEYAWPHDTSLYQEVRRLLPNHFLDLRTGLVHRYWPTAPLPQRSVADAKGDIARRLAGMMEAAANRFDLSMGVSAGLDSRLMLAASRSVKDRMVYYTGQNHERGPRHPDVRIPCRMLETLGVEHHLIPAASEVSEEFAALYRSSVPFANQRRLAGLQAEYRRYALGRVAVLGNVSENARAFYRAGMPDLPRSGFTAQAFADRRDLGDYPFRVKAVQRYLDELEAIDTHGYDFLDLLMWEHGSGIWFAQNVTEFVCAWQDVFLPYNCRALLLDLMSTPLPTRMTPATGLYAAVCRELWPEVLDYPINPLTLQKWFRERAYRPLRSVKRGVLAAVAKVRNALKGWLRGRTAPAP